ncbi:autotransporter translocation and assembly factor TamB [Mucilaginibacter gracilis]|uniref:Autotransporter translocation and assembly factor TamB n=1 Tax=Mucilaginibacter gracilis TaxID=423350 RepID=A0A495J1T5_9SPHI|nr:translocation/assembly module TamB [Mucilaginibacter gracilis]RKR82298.1 autotransporter translocation and assembly factor TamB [Mucilaginibacter gracilis]
MEKFGRLALKTLLWIIGVVIFLVVLVLVLIQVPAVQNYAKDKAVNFLQGKIKTKVKIDRLSIDFPKMIVLQGVYFADQKGDTLLAGDKLKVDIAMLQLLHKKVVVDEINLEGITANITRTPDSLYNYSYIMKAFMSGQKEEPKPADTTSTLKFSLDKVILDKINIKYKDAISGNNVAFLLGHFDTRIKDFDLDKMKFNIPKITLSGFDANIIQAPAGPQVAAAPDTATKPLNLTLNLGTIDFSKINVAYQGGDTKTKVNLGRLLVEMDKIDLKNQNVVVKNIQLENTNGMLSLLKPQNVQKAVVKAIKKADTLMASAQSGKSWSLVLNKMSLVNDNIKFDNEAQKAMPKGLDFGHMDIHNLNADAQDISYDATKIAGRINAFTFSDKSGLKVEKFHTTFLYGEKQSYLNDLYLQTPYTVLQDQVQIAYKSQADMTKNLGELRVHANLNGSKLGLRDVLILMPTMATMEPFKSSPNAAFKINGKVNGQVNNLDIPTLEITGLSNTHIKASATLKGLPNMNIVYFDVKINDFTTSAADINKLAPAGSIPSSFRVPATINVKGTFKGGIKNFTTNLNLHTSDGNLTAIAGLNTSKGGMSYTADLKADNLNAGRLLKQEKNVGNITLTAKVKGSGTNLKTAVAQFSADVVSADIRGYRYQNLVMSGKANRGIITTVARMKDPNISFALNAKANVTKKYPSINMTLNVDSINLQKLHFAKDDMRFHGKLIANIATADPDYLNGDIKLTNIQLVNKGQLIRMDSVLVIATANADSSTMRLKTDMLTAHLAGKYKLTEIAPALQDVVNKYFNTSPANAKTVKVKYSAQQFTFEAKLVKTPLFKQFVPDLKQLDPVIIKGSFDSQAGKLVVDASAPRVVYGTNSINNLKFNINTNNALNYSLTADQIKASQVNLLFASITGNAQNNKLTTSLQIRDAGKKERYRIAGVLSTTDGEFSFSFLQNGLLLDYTQWAVNASNALQFGNKGIMANNFTISNANQILSVNTSPQQYNGPLNVDFKNFKIETITKLADQSSLLVGGVINGTANVTNLNKSATFTSDINITDFNFKSDTLGNVALKVNNQTANAFAANVAITGKGNQVNLDGYYYTDKSSFDMNLNIANLNLKSVEGFTFGNMKQASGAINGKLKITGTTDAPAVRGDINFDNAAFNVSMINSYYKLPKETITFNDDGILFRDFTLVDSAGNKAIIAGTIYTKTYKDYKFGLDITADNFRVFNATQADNKLYYGQVYINSRIKVRGDMNKPIVDGTLKINDKTKLTVVLPQSDPGVEERKGVVEFVDKKKIIADSVFKGKLDSLKRSSLTGLDVAMNITVDKNADFTIVVDEANGDVVHIKGDTQLALGIDPSGKTSLTGTFTVNEGSYDLSYLTINRKFTFKQGSTITWQGDPTSATLDLTAIYIANVAPIDLVDNQLTDESQRTMYKQKLPFNVQLTLKGELLKPDITFGIVLPANTNYNVSADVLSTVNNKLDQLRQDPNELNKQVFAVLLLNHFIGDNPLQSQAGGEGIEGQVRSSVSSLLSDQLNQLAGNLIEGVNLNFALQSGTDYSSGTAQNRTDLNVGLSKQFLNDRLTVSVGNNFNLEGQQANEKATNIAGDISVGYKLSKDGRYMIRAYRKDQYIVVQGQVVETGVGFSLTVDYNRFSQIFRRKTKEEKQMIKDNKQQDKKQKEQDKAKEQKAQDDKQPQTATK